MNFSSRSGSQNRIRRTSLHQRRRLGAERLECRRLLAVAEGTAYEFSTQIDASALVGSVDGSVQWGDGSTSAATVSSINTNGPLTAVIRYDYDTRGFFTTERRALLQAAVDAMVERLTDSLSAITPGSSDNWTATFANPSDRTKQVSLNNLSVKANELIIYAGAQPLPGSQLGEGSFGGYSASGTQSFLNSVSTRGQSGAAGSNPTDFGPWGGSITFDSEITDWYFDRDIDGIQPGEVDFVSVAMHEVAHLLGFGTSQSWNQLVSGSGFTGAKSRAAYDGSGNVPLNGGHWDATITDGGQATLLDPSLSRGTRTYPTALDWAGLDDLGWTLANRQVTVSGSHIYADNATYDVNVVLNGSRIGELSKSLSASVTNVNPTLEVSENLTATVGQSISIADLGQISDPGFRNAANKTDETFSYSIDWGDSSALDSGDATIDRVGNSSRTTLASFDANHTYTSNGTKTVRVTVTDDDGGNATQNFQIVVGLPPALLLTVNRSSINENAGSGAAELTVSRGAASTTTAQTVSLSSSDLSEASIATSVTIPAGQTSVVVPVTAIDDNLLDGDQIVRFVASASGFDDSEVGLAVKDVESIIASLNVSEIAEDELAAGMALTVRRSNTDTQTSMIVQVAGDPSGSLGIGSTVTIPAGQQQVVIPLAGEDDTLQQGPRTFELSFTADAYLSGAAELLIRDDEPAFYQNPDNPLDVNGDTFITPIDALRILNSLNLNGGSRRLDPVTEPLGTSFFDTNGDYQLTPLDALIVINAIGRQATGEAALTAEKRDEELWAVDIDWLLDLENRDL
ncbi:dockerin type I domain-containing protein [Rosistilla ulvae]|uniref:dockerin type I domain-containing protein n=1 Tax=Rosistilla ulvae TaxID=1930277 RepID=UPI00119E96B9|nr:dockerin type I domain-containing protein [Rosistilla ulvae]